MSDAIKRAAQSMSGFDNPGPRWLNLAARAISAIREPTEAMLLAGSRHHCFHSEGQINDDARRAWRAMIDAAIAEHVA